MAAACGSQSLDPCDSSRNRQHDDALHRTDPRQSRLHRFCETGFHSRCRRAMPALNDRFHIHLATNSTCLLEQPNDTLARLMTDTTRSISTADLSHQRGLRLDRSLDPRTMPPPRRSTLHFVPKAISDSSIGIDEVIVFFSTVTNGGDCVR